MALEIPADFTEAYRVVQTIELVHGALRAFFRIEIVEVRKNPRIGFAAHYYELCDGTWRRLSGPGWVASDDIELASHQALGFLALHLRGRPTPEPDPEPDLPVNPEVAAAAARVREAFAKEEPSE